MDIAQKLGAGKYIKKPYVLEKIGIDVNEELKKLPVFDLLLNAGLPIWYLNPLPTKIILRTNESAI